MLRNKINWAIPVAVALACGLLLAGCGAGAPSVSGPTDEAAVTTLDGGDTTSIRFP